MCSLYYVKKLEETQMKKVLSILLSVAMIVLCFAACGKTDGDKSSTGKAANVKVGFIFLHDENST